MANHGLIVAFYQAPVKNGAKSAEAGRDIYEDRVFIRKIVPGDKNSEVDTLATDEDFTKFAEEYARFKAGKPDALEGTPLEQWPQMTRASVKEWHYLNVYTIEQLANLSDTAKQAFGMGADNWVRMAKAHLELAESSAATERYAVQNADLKRELDDLKAKFADLAASHEKHSRKPHHEKGAQA